jgi:hypothetical protein
MHSIAITKKDVGCFQIAVKQLESVQRSETGENAAGKKCGACT